jgi:hypothetical protein
MWQLITNFLHVWFSRPASWVATIGILSGFLLFLLGMLTNVSRDKKLGLTVIGLSTVAGILLFFYG